MNFLLRNLEASVGEESLVEGEQLLEKGAIGSLKEVDRHLWVTTVEEAPGAAFLEVEIKISPTRVLAGSCECRTFRNSGECAHFTAALLALRKELSRRLEQKKAQKKSGGHQPKLTTSVVLDNVDYAELVDFVKEYARRHRSFSIALKARFTSNVEVIDSKEKFIQLLDSTINMARRPDRTITSRGLSHLLKVLGELRDQREAAISQGHFKEAVAIIQSIVERLPPILAKVNGPTKELETELRRHLDAWRHLLQQPLAPALRQAAWTYALTEHNKRVYRKYGIDLLFFQMLLELSRDAEQVDELLQALDEQTGKYRLEQRPPGPLLLLKWQLLEQAGRHQLAVQLVEEHLSQAELLLPAIELALHKQQTGLARRLAEAGISALTEPAKKRALHEHLIRIAEMENDAPLLIALLRERFLQTLDPTVYHRLRQANAAQWEQQRPALLADVRQLPPSNERREMLALLLSEEKDPHRLLNYLRDAASLDLLQRYDHSLIPNQEEEVLALYKELLTAYVQDHLGPKSSRKIRQTLDHLNEIGQRDLAGRLAQEFRDNYPERHTLMEELAPF